MQEGKVKTRHKTAGLIPFHPGSCPSRSTAPHPQIRGLSGVLSIDGS